MFRNCRFQHKNVVLIWFPHVHGLIWAQPFPWKLFFLNPFSIILFLLPWFGQACNVWCIQFFLSRCLYSVFYADRAYMIQLKSKWWCSVCSPTIQFPHVNRHMILNSSMNVFGLIFLFMIFLLLAGNYYFFLKTNVKTIE
jgi:hypothetical protein